MARVLDLTNPRTLAAVARRVGLVAKGRFSQNFMIDRAVLDSMVEALAPTPDDAVLEIGPGVGALTGALAAQAGRVVAVDIDEACVRATTITQRHAGNVEVVHQDALRLDPADVGLTDQWLAAGNLPYHLTGALLEHLFGREHPPQRGVFLIQREVAARLSATSGDWSLATVAMRSIAEVERLGDVPPSAFLPAPSVHSTIIRMTPSAVLLPQERQAVIDLARLAFQMRRKTLRHALTHALGGDAEAAREVLAIAYIDASRRPGTLDLQEWRTLASAATGLRRDG